MVTQHPLIFNLLGKSGSGGSQGGMEGFQEVEFKDCHTFLFTRITVYYCMYYYSFNDFKK